MSEELAKEVWHTIETNGGYQFNASHSVAYTLISYLCMWLKVHYPAEFFAVASEAFFIAPALLADGYPDIYRKLAAYYRQDPLGSG